MPAAKPAKKKPGKKLSPLEQQIADLKASLPPQQDWRSTDAQEVARRRIRALENPPAIRNLTPEHRVYSNFEVTSPESGLTYQVEIRDLAHRDFHSTSPDFAHNGLGTCKHTEAVLAHLQQRFPRLYKSATKQTSTRCELVIDPESLALKLLRPEHATLPRPFQLCFNKSGLLKANKTPERALTLAESVTDANFRISQAVRPFLETLRRENERHQLRRDYEQRVHSGEYPQHETKLPLFPYQREGMLHLAFAERAMVADEMGLGKTIQGIAAAALLHRMGKATRCLVVTPASLKSEWEEQIAKFTHLPCEVIYGGRRDRVAAYQNPSAFFTIVNYEQVRSDTLDINAAFKADIVILDEAQRIKNWASKTARAIKRLESRYAFVLTGTPIENRIDELYSIIEFLNPSIFGPLFRFNRDYYSLDERGKPEGYRQLELLRKKLDPVVLRRRKADVETELPERTDETRFIDLTEDQRQEYASVQEQVRPLVHKARTRPLRKEEHQRLMILLGMMRMLCDSQFILDQETKVSPKLDELIEIYDTALADPDTKIIVFSEWIRMLTLVREHLERRKIGYAWHTGSVPQIKRRKEINAFKEDPDCRILLSTESGGSGLNLQNASIVINVDLPWNPAKLEQRIARAWRKGQKRPVTVINLVARNTIEHGMLETLAIKQGLSDGVLDGMGELSEVKLKRGGQSFISRLEQTLLVGENTVTKKAQPKRASMDPAASFAQALQKDLRDKLIGCEEQFVNDPDSPARIVVILGKDSPGSRNTIVAHLKETMPNLKDAGPDEIDEHLLIMDESTAKAIQHAQRLGLLQTNVRARRNLLGVTDPAPTLQLSDEDRRLLAELHEELSRKLKMAQLLLPAGLEEEVRPALHTALLLSARIKAITTHATPPSSTDDLLHSAFQPLLPDPELTLDYLSSPSPPLAARILQLLGA